MKAGGMVGISKNPSARQKWAEKWAVTSFEWADIVRCCRDMVAVRHCCPNVRLQKKKRVLLALPETSGVFRKYFRHCQHGKIDPFLGGKLHQLSSGSVASEQLRHDLLQAKAKGEAALLKFVKERLETNNVSIH